MERSIMWTRGVAQALVLSGLLALAPGLAGCSGGAPTSAPGAEPSGQEALSLTSGSIITGSSDPTRSGWYSDEAALAPAIVSNGSFSRLFSATLDGQVYAQPL